MTVPVETVSAVTQNPFAVITIIAAPAILTNAASILTLSTSTRLLRCLDRVNQLSEKIDHPGLSDEQKRTFLRQVNRSHRQSKYFLSALRAIYLSLGCFALASFLAIVGASTISLTPHALIEVLAALGLGAGGIGILGFVWAGWNLIQASRITVEIIADDMDLLNKRHALAP